MPVGAAASVAVVTNDYVLPTKTVTTVAPPLPPAEPPPQSAIQAPPGLVFDTFYRPMSPTSVKVDLYTGTVDASCPPNVTDISDSVTHVICEPRVCGLHGDSSSAVTLREDPLVDGGSNICVTGDLGILLDVVDIQPISISSLDDCITKEGLLPLRQMVRIFTNPAFTALTLSRQSFRHRQFWPRATSSLSGTSLATKTLRSLGVSASLATTALRL
jgi:hypothetical protein